MKDNEDLLSIEHRADYQSQIKARTKIIEILTKVDTRQAYSDKLLDRELVQLEEIDRRFVTEIVNGVLRWRLRLDWYLNQLYLGEYENLITDVKNNLRSSVYQLVYMDKVPAYAVLYEAVEIAKEKYNQKTANLVNAILRNFLRQHKKFEFLESQLNVLEKFSIRYSHPKWLVQRWIEYWGIDEVKLLCEANNSRPRLSVRINEERAKRDALLRLLEENQISFQAHDDFENFVWIDNFQDFRKLDLINRGWVSVQDISTGIPVLLLDPQPAERILDMCAAPGGKAGFIVEKLADKGRLFALDRHGSRLHILAENFRKLGYTAYNSIVADATTLPLQGTFDKILIDAPCSGYGVLNKRVDIKWKRTEQDILNMKNLQLELLESAAIVLKKHGKLVYCTCTIEPEENEVVVRKFLEGHPEFELIDLRGLLPDSYISEHYFVRTFPHKHLMDGSFAALLSKKT
ncbi:MAG: 16S rRNA (cytosine(967)-C(5))-methyltransferase RsmB [bacterium]|nr:MAG: 16S rRNA (cytosine(967)-C(5))-methyltransferase RsmB [bacterium]